MSVLYKPPDDKRYKLTAHVKAGSPSSLVLSEKFNLDLVPGNWYRLEAYIVKGEVYETYLTQITAEEAI